jgi:LuxR family maltose regulon positive regulatory protein
LPDQLGSLLAIKAQPPAVPPTMVRRRRLAEQLTASTKLPFTLVSGGPGAGKTLAAAAWAASGDVPGKVAWLSLDESDNDPTAFWSNILGALGRSGGVPDLSPLRDIIPTAGFGVAESLEVRSRLTELPAPIVLVLDDFQEITSEAVLETFGQLVDHLPGPLRLVLLTRADPVLRLHRLRVNGALTEIRADELAFTDEETAELFEVYGLQLTADQVLAVRERTEGWPAGLRLAAMSLDADDLDGGIKRFSGSERSVADYLVGEVTQRLSVQDRDFLLKTSVVERLSGDLADHLTDGTGSQARLERFVRANALVVALGGQNEWFSYHRLLRELLRHRVALEQPRVVPELHRRAAQWMAERGEATEAIRHSILAGDIDGAGRTLLSAIPKILSPEGPALAAAIEPLAMTAQLKPSLSALLASATFHFHRREIEAMVRDAAEAREFLDEANEDVRPSAEVVITLFEMAGARGRGDTALIIDRAEQAVRILDERPRRAIPVGRHYRVVANVNLAGARAWSDQPGDAEQILGTLLPEALELGLLLPHLNALGHLALLDALHGRFRTAQRRTTEAMQIIDRRGWVSEPQALATFLALGLLALARNRRSDATAFINRGLMVSRDGTDRSLRLALAVAAVEAAVSRGDGDAAMSADVRAVNGISRTPKVAELLVRWSNAAAGSALLLAGRPAEVLTRIPRPGGDSGFAGSWERVIAARARLALGQASQAEGLIAPLLEPGNTYLEPVVAAHLLQALIADRNHRDTVALSAIGAAVELAQPEGISRPFHLIGGRIAELLVRHQNLGGKQEAFVAELVKELAPSVAEGDHGTAMIEHLTERELSVLRYLPTMLKAGEIASDLYVSVNTVKAHLRSMYRKLGVTNRREAVERARALGLL